MKAFVKYDQFPYTLCVTVDHIANDGAISTKELGPNMYYHPESILRFLPDEEADAIDMELKLLKAQFDDEVRLLREQYHAKIVSVAKFVVI